MKHPTPYHTLFESGLPRWLVDASAAQRDRLEHLTLSAHRACDALAQRLRDMPSARDFALDALRPHLSAGVDPEQVRIVRHYQTACVPDVGDLNLSKPLVNALGALLCPMESVDNSLLHAALGNYPSSGGYGDRAESFEVVGSDAVDPGRFVELVHRLDIGQGYQDRLSGILPSRGDDALPVKTAYLSFQHALFELAVCEGEVSGRLDAHVARDARHMLSRATPSGDVPSFEVHSLALFGRNLFGARMVAMGHPSGTTTRRLLYAPNHPNGALQVFSSERALKDAMIADLKQEALRGFWLRMALLEDQPRLLARVKANLRSDGQVSDAERSAVQSTSLDDRLPWPSYDQWRTAILANAAVQAVPASTLNKASRDRAVARLVDDCQQLLYTAAMLFPGCQPLGWSALAVYVHGIADQIYAGYQAWQLGDREAAIACLYGMALNLGGGAVMGHVQGRFLGGLMLMEDHSGQPRLWRKDLAPYRASSPLSAARGDGTYKAAGRTWLRLEGQDYPVRGAGDTFQLDLPANHVGVTPQPVPVGERHWAWNHEDPLRWTGIHLLRSFPDAAEHLSDQVAWEALQLSGVSEEQLRYARANAQPLPALVRYWFEHREMRQRLLSWTRDLRAGGLAAIDAEPVMAELTRLAGWPGHVALGYASASAYATIGASDATAVVDLDDASFATGLWHQRVLSLMTDQERAVLTGEADPDRQGLALAQRWAARLESSGEALHRSIMRGQPDNDAEMPVWRQFPGLPRLLVQAIVENADQQALDRLAEGHVPAEVGTVAALVGRELRVGAALEALERGCLDDDGDRLFMANLQRLPGWQPALHLTLKDESSIGPALGHVGADDLPVSSLVRRVDGYRLARGDSHEVFATLEQAVFACLPEAARTALGLKDEAALRSRVTGLAWQDWRIARADLGIQAAQVPNVRLPQRINGRLGYPLSGYARGTAGRTRLTPTGRLGRLFPNLSTVEIIQLQHTLTEMYRQPLVEIAARLEADWAALDQSLSNWLRAAVEPARSGSALDRLLLSMRRSAADRLRMAWRREIRLSGRNSVQVPGLDLAFLPVGELPALTVDFQHVEILRLTHMRLRDGLSEFIARFPRVRELTLDRNGLTFVPGAVAHLAHLESLDLAGNPLAGTPTMFEKLSPSLAGQPNRTLRMLDISAIGPIPATALEPLARLPELRELTWNDAVGVSAQHLEVLSRMTHLRILTLENSGIRLTDDSIGFTAALTELSGLYLGRNPLGRAPRLGNLRRLVILELHNAQLTEVPEDLLSLMMLRPLLLSRVDISGNRLQDIGSLIPPLQAVRDAGHSISLQLQVNPLREADIAALAKLDIFLTHQNDAWMGVDVTLQRAASRLRGSRAASLFLDWVGQEVRARPSTSGRYGSFLRALLDTHNAFAHERIAITDFATRLNEFRQRIYGQIHDPVWPTAVTLNRQLAAFRAAQAMDWAPEDDRHDSLLRHNYDTWQAQLRERYGTGIQADAELSARTTRAHFVDWLLDAHDELNQLDVQERVGEQDWRPYLDLIDSRWTRETDRWNTAGGLLDEAVSGPVDSGQLPSILIDHLIRPGDYLPRAWTGLGGPEDSVEPVDDVAWRPGGEPGQVTLSEDQYRRAAVVYRRVRLMEMGRLARVITEEAVTPWWEPVQE